MTSRLRDNIAPVQQENDVTTTLVMEQGKSAVADILSMIKKTSEYTVSCKDKTALSKNFNEFVSSYNGLLNVYLELLELKKKQEQYEHKKNEIKGPPPPSTMETFKKMSEAVNLFNDIINSHIEQLANTLPESIQNQYQQGQRISDDWKTLFLNEMKTAVANVIDQEQYDYFEQERFPEIFRTQITAPASEKLDTNNFFASNLAHLKAQKAKKETLKELEEKTREWQQSIFPPAKEQNQKGVLQAAWEKVTQKFSLCGKK